MTTARPVWTARRSPALWSGWRNCDRGAGMTEALADPRRAAPAETGAVVLDPRTQDVVFRRGPMFTNLLLADEINRTPPKTQAALLEAMAERQVSADGISYPLPQPFIVLATDNPIEYEGTYPLPEAQLDRFTARIRLGYLDPDGAPETVRRRLSRRPA